MHYNARIFNPSKIRLENLLIRPYMTEFLEKMRQYFEIIAFTVGVKEYADKVMIKLNRSLFDKVLSRESAYAIGTQYVKNLDLLDRQMCSTLIVDNTSENFQLHKNNGIFIKTWFGDTNDDELLKLGNFLEELVKKGFTDFPTILAKYRDHQIRQIYKEKQIQLTLKESIPFANNDI